MKKLFALLLLFAILTTGCASPNKYRDVNDDDDNSVEVTEEELSGTFDIYASDKFQAVDSMGRAQYRQLNDGQKTVYKKLDNAVNNMTTGYIKLGNIEEHDLEAAYYALRCDRPEYFWVPSSYTIRTSTDSMEICFAKNDNDWLYTKSQRREIEDDIREELSDFIEVLDEDMSEYELELAIHDYLAEKTVYDHDALLDSDKYNYAWTIVGAFKKGKAVCEGYSRAMQLMCYAVGIECTLITGVTSELHMWNLVKIDGEWYHVDLTANDADSGTYHFFFNVTTEYMLKGREIDSKISTDSDKLLTVDRYNLFVPKCTETENNYHIVNSSYIASMSHAESTIVSQICQAVRNGKKSVEISVSEEIDFVFGEDDVNKRFNLERCISAANAELSSSQQLRSYAYGGVYGALGFVISW